MQLSRTRIVAGVAAATLSLALLAGCGEDEPRPKFEDPTSASPSKSASPEEPVEPTPPAAMEGDDVAGAKAFVEYYFDLLGYAQATGKTAAVEGVALADCVPCGGSVGTIRDAYDNGGYIHGGEFRVAKVRASELGGGTQGFSTFTATAVVATTSQEISGSSDKKMNGQYPAGSQKMQFVLTHGAQGWRMAEWSVL